MNKKKLFTAFVASLLSFLALLGGLGCMVTAFSLEIDPTALVLGCAILSLGTCFFWDTRLWLLPLCLGALLLGYWWQEGTLRLSLESLLYQLSDFYDKGYGWGILQWTDRNDLPRDVTPALLLAGLPTALSVGLTTVKGRLGWVGAGFSLLPLISCILLKDTVPAPLCLALLFFAVLMLLLTERVRSSNATQANTLTLTLLLPLTLGLALLFTFIPQDGYHMQAGAQALEDWVLGIFEQNKLPEGPALLPGDQAQVVNLSNVGKRSQSGKSIMTVQAQEDATIYLRGCAYDVYDGTSWSSTPGWNAWNLFYSATGDEVKSLNIRTNQPHSVYYFTYSPYAEPAKVIGGRMRNENELTSYTIYYRSPVTYGEDWDLREDAIGGEDLAEYLQLPEKTREGAMQILTKKVGIPGETINSGQIWKNALYIADWVSHRAKYDLSTGKMPSGEEDFALWFLNEADTGYCTHYATAATVLLRAAGIPAQYVTGYLVQAKNGRTVTVTEDNAHAWVEVFINGVGWVALEPTPSLGLTQTVGGEEGPSTPSRPSEPSTETTAPPPATEESTEPQTTTAPAGTTAPTSAPTETEGDFSHPTATIPSSDLAGFGGADPGKPANKALEKPLLILLVSLGALLAVILQWRIRVAVKKSLTHRGEPNRRALRLWKQLAFACRMARVAAPEDCLQLAQKARFSQHTLSKEELVILQQALKKAHRTLRKRNLLLQPIYTLILAIY